MGRRGLRLITLAAIPVLALSACSSTSATPTAAPNTIRWFVGLGSGTQPNQITDQQAFVDAYNKTSGGITLKLEIVPNANATDVLKTEIAAGKAPDIIGPVGVKGRNGFEGLFLDLTSEIAKNNYDLTAFDPSLVNFFKTSDQGQVGLPYDIFPGYIWYNKDLFTAAGLPALPTTVGAQYQGQTWDWTELAAVAAQLTTDKNGVKASDTAGTFDKADPLTTYGIDFQWADGRRMASDFGAGSFVAADGKTAQIPAVWSDAFNWYYTAIWGDATHNQIAPNSAEFGSDYLASGTSSASGHVAMEGQWGWAISSIAKDAATAKVKTWDMGVVPSWKGATTAGMDADTFTIAKASKNPDAAFKAMVAIEASSTLLAQGNSQSSGNVAMNAAWGWSIGSIWDAKTNKATMKAWDMGVVPSWNGTTTSPLDADTFTISKASKYPDQAFKAMVAIMADGTLMKDYGGEPAKTADQAGFFTSFDTTLAPIFPNNKVTWSVLGEMQKHPAVPSIEANMPNFTTASNDYGAFYTKLQGTAGLNINDELTKLQTTLQADFNNSCQGSGC
jgi:multiple sugar transport system substrate-binding protein